MSWLALLLIGVVVLIVGYMAPLPHPVPTILRIVGWIMVAIGGILLVLGLFGSMASTDVEFDGAPQVALVS